mgnify:CR=1 FL=1
MLVLRNDRLCFLPYHGLLSATSWRDSVVLAVLLLGRLHALAEGGVRLRRVVCKDVSESLSGGSGEVNLSIRLELFLLW